MPPPPPVHHANDCVVLLAASRFSHFACSLRWCRRRRPPVQHANDCAVRLAASRFAHFACSLRWCRRRPVSFLVCVCFALPILVVKSQAHNNSNRYLLLACPVFVFVLYSRIQPPLVRRISIRVYWRPSSMLVVSSVLLHWVAISVSRFSRHLGVSILWSSAVTCLHLFTCSKHHPPSQMLNMILLFLSQPIFQQP